MRETFNRKAGQNEKYIENLKIKLSKFLEEADLAESALILDGPGLGCPSAAFVLPLLGEERLKKLKAIHCFSGSGYTLFWYDAFKKGQLKYTPDTIRKWNKKNQERHGVRFPIIQIPQFIFRKLRGKKYIFSMQPREAMELTVSYGYATEPLKYFPANYNFWSHDVTENKLVSFHSQSELNFLNPSDVMQAMSAVPHLYRPLECRGHKYQDAFYSPDLKRKYSELSRRYKHVLFVHMQRDGVREHVHYIKGHRHGKGTTRVIIDFLYFVAGLENPEFNEGMEYFLTLLALPET